MTQNFRVMLTERDLLIDIIQNTPDNSVWNISSDSWERIPEVFSQYISENEVYGWEIIISQKNRDVLTSIIDDEEIYDKIVHQSIMFSDDIIFESYDNMMSSYLKREFPCFNDIMKKYIGQEVEISELKPSF